MTGNKVKVHFLKDLPEHGPTAMEWIYYTWGAGPGKTLGDVKRNAVKYCNSARLPIMFIATFELKPAGCVILAERDMEGWEQLSPWLASLYVVPGFRGMGIAKRLERFLTDVAAKLGFESIYLFTADAVHFYEKIGWKSLKIVKYFDNDVSIMIKNIV